MDSATLERLFDPYFTTKEAGKGSGLGLAVVRSIVKRHGGGISVSSQEGKGTTFRVYLPRIERESTTLGEPSSSIPGGDERILFVDDEVLFVELWQMALERLGYKVVTKTSCLEALELFRVHPDYFDLVITDYAMPHMSGVDLAKNLIHIRPDIPIILCTGWRERISDEKTRKAGVCAFMTKPLELRSVAEVIRKVLNEKRKNT
jgi:CheY-like chemotaxis protein